MILILLATIFLVGQAVSQASEPSSRDCAHGKVYNNCGTPCPLTCDNYLMPPSCALECVEGCFCPPGQVLLDKSTCVDPEECPVTEVEITEVNTGAAGPCATKTCQPNYCCKVSDITGDGICVPDCERNNGGCPDDEFCEIVSYNCLSQPCDPSLHIRCTRPPYVPCESDAFLACDSEWTYCLQQNKTRRASCVGSCFYDNGNCGSDEVCVTALRDNGDSTLQCLERDKLLSDCPAGQVMNECGDHCQETCEQHVTGESFACIEICGPPACVCPEGLILFRDRCVDPRLCYVLTRYLPPINPLPLVGSQYLYSLIAMDSTVSDFKVRPFLGAISQILTSGGFPDVKVDLHGLYQDQGLQIVVKLSGDTVDEGTSAQVTDLLQDNTAMLPLPVQQVVLVDADRVQNDLKSCATTAIASALGILGLLVLLAFLSLALICCYARRRRRNKDIKSMHAEQLKIYNLMPQQKQKEEEVVEEEEEEGEVLPDKLELEAMS